MPGRACCVFRVYYDGYKTPSVDVTLGDFFGVGPRSAIPAMSRIQHLRIRYIAEEAIAKIEGKPVPAWH